MNDFKTLKGNLKKESLSFPSVKAALLGDTATQFLAIALRGAAIERGFRLDIFEAGYNQVERQVLDPVSEYHALNADYTIVFQSTHKLLGTYDTLSPEQCSGLAENRLAFVKQLCALYHGRIIYFNYPELDDGVFGGFANKTERSFIWQVRKLNYELIKLAACTPNFFIADIAALQAKLGRDFCFTPSIYTNSEMVLSLDCLPWVASRIIDIIAACMGSFKKCLILDLDNTLWGGVIGDDGLEKIQLGHGLGIGKIFTEFQQWVKKLKERGIILAVCSKNDVASAKEPFLKHPDMVLRLEDIAVFMANWDNKADNIRRIQSILNIGFDSMVFLDDNPAERAIVRENLPGITVSELPEDPAEWLEYLYGENLFETASLSVEDAGRTKQYQAEAERAVVQKTFTNEADFLKSLGMICVASGFIPFNIPRIAQLSQRSNQFNLRTVRYTEADVERLAGDGRYANFAFSLRDKFGDHGLVCVVVMREQDSETLFIENWFMSCRVLKRGMEDFTLNTIAAYALKGGYRRIIGEYIPTAKNAMVAEHYPKMGFVPLGEIREGSAQYVLDAGVYQVRECFIATEPIEENNV